MWWIKRQTCYNIILLKKVSSDELAMINYLGKPQTLKQRNCCDLLIQCVEWTSTHQCTSWGWGCWTHFVDEPKAHPPYPKLLFFFTSFLPQKFSLLPTYPLSYLPSHISHLPPHSYLPLPYCHCQSPRAVWSESRTGPELAQSSKVLDTRPTGHS